MVASGSSTVGWEVVTVQAVIGSSKVETNVAINTRIHNRGQRSTFVLGVPDPVVFRSHGAMPPGVRLQDVLLRAVRPVSDGGTHMRRRVVHVPPVFAIQLNRLYEGPGRVGDGVRDTPVLFPPAIGLDPIFGLGEATVRVLRAVVVDGDSQGDEGHLWNHAELGSLDLRVARISA
jgi:hypothetical protein